MSVRADLGGEPDAWNRLDVQRWPSLARTRVTVTGALDHAAIEAIDRAARAAERSAHVLTLDLTHVSTITPGARDELIARDRAPRASTP